MNETENVAGTEPADKKERKKEIKRLRTILARKGWQSEIRDGEHGQELVVLADSAYKAAMLDRFLRRESRGYRVRTWHCSAYSAHSPGPPEGRALVRDWEHTTTLTQAASTWLHEQAELGAANEELLKGPANEEFGVLLMGAGDDPIAVAGTLATWFPSGNACEAGVRAYYAMQRVIECRGPGTSVVAEGIAHTLAETLVTALRAAGAEAVIYDHSGRETGEWLGVAVHPDGPWARDIGKRGPDDDHDLVVVGDQTVPIDEIVYVFAASDIARRHGLGAPEQSAASTH